jgi:hypothetical protein
MFLILEYTKRLSLKNRYGYIYKFKMTNSAKIAFSFLVFNSCKRTCYLSPMFHGKNRTDVIYRKINNSQKPT